MSGYHSKQSVSEKEPKSFVYVGKITGNSKVKNDEIRKSNRESVPRGSGSAEVEVLSN